MKAKKFKIFVLFLVLTYFIPSLLFSQVRTAWIRRYNGPGDSTDLPTALTIDTNGNVYVTGYSIGSSTDWDYATLKYDRNGNLVWARRYNSLENDWANSLAVDRNGNVYVAGSSYNPSTSLDYLILKYDPNGNLLWERRYNGPGNSGDWANVIVIDREGNIYVTGWSIGLRGDADYTTLKYDADGNLLWERRYDCPENRWDMATALAIDTNGNMYVTGLSWDPSTGEDFLTVKYDQYGNLLWAKTYNGPANGNDNATALAIDNQGNLYVTGFCWGAGTFSDYLMLKYDANGNLLWERRYNGPANSYDEAISLAVDSDNNVYVTGWSIGFGTYSDYATLKYDENGNLLWEMRYNGSANDSDVAAVVVVDTNGNVYVTGRSVGSGTSYDYLTLKYNKYGNLLWETRYNGPGNWWDVATSLKVDVNGNLYVTGYSYRYGTGYDYLTIKYIQESNISEEKENKIIKKLSTKTNKIYDLSGKLVKEKKLKKGIYFQKTEKGIEKILILK